MITVNIPKDIIDKYRRGETLTPEEREILDSWLKEDEVHRNYLEKVTRPGYMEDLKRVALQTDIEAMSREIEARLDKKEGRLDRRPVVPVKRMFARMAAAVLILGAGVYLLVRFIGNLTTPQNVIAWDAPTSLIRIILPDGKAVYPDSAARGLVASTQGLNIIRTDSGQLAFAWVPGRQQGGYKGYISVTIPKKEGHQEASPANGKYQVALPDGSKVWLNVASSMRIPVAFVEGERNVDMRGEAYFDVAPDKDHPFTVDAGIGRDSVLGTKFNVRAYPDEHRFSTSVSEGLVKVNLPGITRTLSRGEGVRYDTNIPERIISWHRSDSVGAWRHGILNFSNLDPRGVAEILTKEYDLDPPRYFNGADTLGPAAYGSVGGEVPLEKVIKLLKGMGDVDFRLVGRSIHVAPK
jgi:ferric-dicitrate binding protein FerR (iron transport regulator)